MDELKDIIAQNLTQLRKKSDLTQSELAEQLNYSDKAISKWERGESLPDVEVLYHLASKYGVTLDYLTQAVHAEDETVLKGKISQRVRSNRVTIALLAVSVVWFFVMSVYIYVKMFLQVNYWMAFLWGIPASCVILLVFNFLWGRRLFTFYIVSVLIWSVLVCAYLSLMHLNLWIIFFMGIPSQVAIILWSGLKRHSN